nr:pentatricopeptide repeat-containing protein [Quercus suber]
MIRTPVLNKTHLLLSTKDPKLTEFDLRLKEQECLSLLKRCKSMEELKQVHVQILKFGLFWDSFCASNLVASCALSDWGSMDYACSIFRQLKEPGTFVFNTMIRGHVKDASFEEALLVYYEMIERGIEADNFTYPALLKACARSLALEEGMQIHGHIFKLGLEDDVFVQNSLISMYGKFGEGKKVYAMHKIIRRAFQDDKKEAVHLQYHTRYQEQMSHWPEQAVNIIMKWLTGRNSSLVVADFGSGDARLAKNVKNKVFSLDLVTNDPSVIVCDMSNTPPFTHRD